MSEDTVSWLVTTVRDLQKAVKNLEVKDGIATNMPDPDRMEFLKLKDRVNAIENRQLAENKEATPDDFLKELITHSIAHTNERLDTHVHHWKKAIDRLDVLEELIKTIPEDSLLPHTVEQVKSLVKNEKKIFRDLHEHNVRIAAQERKVNGMDEAWSTCFDRTNKRLDAVEEMAQEALEFNEGDDQRMREMREDFTSFRDSVFKFHTRVTNEINEVTHSLNHRMTELSNDINGLAHYTGYADFMGWDRPAKKFGDLIKDWPEERKARVNEKTAALRDMLDTAAAEQEVDPYADVTEEDYCRMVSKQGPGTEEDQPLYFSGEERLRIERDADTGRRKVIIYLD